MSASARGGAIVFAYSGVGVRGLSAILANDLPVQLVVTHEDDPGENIWFDSVAALAALNRIPVITPDDPNDSEVVQRIKALAQDWFFSFYYRKLLGGALLSIPRFGAFNMHGSLLPAYRGRAPVNWAVLKGETQTGASLHRMVEKPDAGDLVDQQAVPILPNDTAGQVYEKVACAAEMVLMRALPRMLAGTAAPTPLDLAKGSYYGGRKPEDGRIDWSWPTRNVHNLVRAVAPPYPGAFFDHGSLRLMLLGSYYCGESATREGAGLYWQDGRLYADGGDGERLQVLDLRIDGERLDEASFTRRFGERLALL